MKTYNYLIIVLLLTLMSCDRISNKAKRGVNKGGEVVGQTATEFFEGISEGVDKTLECEILLSEKLQQNGLETGAFSIENHSPGSNNKLVLYLIFKTNFKKALLAKAYNKNGLEIGRAQVVVEGKAGDASYFDFQFDKRTNIGFRNKITIE